MRALALAALLLAAVPVKEAAAYEPREGGLFADLVIPVTEPVPAPETLIDLEGGARTSLEAYRGRVAVVVMWATWCHVCELEMPIVDRLAGAFEGRPLAVLPLSLDEAPAEERVARHIAAEGWAHLPLMIDRHHGMANRVGVVGTPTTVIVDKFGQVVAAFEGQGPWDDPETTAYLEALMAAETAEASRLILAR